MTSLYVQREQVLLVHHVACFYSRNRQTNTESKEAFLVHAWKEGRSVGHNLQPSMPLNPARWSFKTDVKKSKLMQWIVTMVEIILSSFSAIVRWNVDVVKKESALAHICSAGALHSRWCWIALWKKLRRVRLFCRTTLKKPGPQKLVEMNEWAAFFHAGLSSVWTQPYSEVCAMIFSCLTEAVQRNCAKKTHCEAFSCSSLVRSHCTYWQFTHPNPKPPFTPLFTHIVHSAGNRSHHQLV